MKCLGISSADKTIGASVVTDKGVEVEFSASGSDAKSEKLVSIIDSVLQKADIKISKIDGIAVVKGPGSYSGLRGGLAVAKSFAATLMAPIVGISTLEAIAYNFINSTGTIAVVIHACRDEYNAALFSSNGSNLQRLTDDLVLKQRRLVEFLSDIKGELTLASEEKIYKEVDKKNDSSNIILADHKNIVPWAVNVAKLGILKFKTGEKEDYISITPEYSHKPNIREYGKR